MKTSHFLRLQALTLAWLLAPASNAFTYHDEDVILVFHKDGNNDVEFNLGHVGQFLNHPDGFRVTVTNWNAGVVRSNYDLGDDARVLVLASTGLSSTNRRAWVSSGDTQFAVLDRTPSQWQGLWSKISAIGSRAQEYSVTNASTSFVVAPSELPSFDYIASNAGTQPGLVPYLGGASAFNVEQAVPASLRFYEIKPSSLLPKPASALVGQFSLGTNGVLVFTAGSPIAAARIAKVSATGGAVAIQFESVAGVHYRLRSSEQLQGAPSTWSLGVETVTGSGGTDTLHDAAASGAARFYVVESYP